MQSRSPVETSDLLVPESAASAAAPALGTDWRSWLEPVTPLDPCGPNLEYAAEFADFERAVQGTPDRRMGTAVVPGQPPDPDVVIERGAALLRRSKDLRIAVPVLHATLARGGPAAFLTGVGAVREMLERYWDTLHPSLDPEADARATARANALLALARPETLHALRNAAWCELPGFGAIRLEQLTALRDAVGAAATPTGENARLAAAWRQAPPAGLRERAAAVARALEQLLAIGALFEAHEAAAPDLSSLSRCLREALALLRSQLPPAPEGEAAAPRPEPLGVAPAPVVSSIRERADVIRALDEICSYYREREPSSPLPLLLRRCQRLASLDFLEILKELAPEALPKLGLISGSAIPIPPTK